MENYISFILYLSVVIMIGIEYIKLRKYQNSLLKTNLDKVNYKYLSKYRNLMVSIILYFSILIIFQILSLL